MTVHVESLTTEVVMEPERTEPADARASADWEEERRVAAAAARSARDELRNRARGYDD